MSTGFTVPLKRFYSAAEIIAQIAADHERWLRRMRFEAAFDACWRV